MASVPSGFGESIAFVAQTISHVCDADFDESATNSEGFENWCRGNRATYHMTSHKEFMRDFDLLVMMQ